MRGMGKKEKTKEKMKEEQGHIIITINIRLNDLYTGTVKRGKISLVQMGNYEVSQLTLSRIMVALTDNKSHVPYRDTKFTRYMIYIYIYISRILQEMLGGNCSTSLILTANPCQSMVKQTLKILSIGGKEKLEGPKMLSHSALKKRQSELTHEERAQVSKQMQLRMVILEEMLCRLGAYIPPEEELVKGDFNMEEWYESMKGIWVEMEEGEKMQDVEGSSRYMCVHPVSVGVQHTPGTLRVGTQTGCGGGGMTPRARALNMIYHGQGTQTYQSPRVVKSEKATQDWCFRREIGTSALIPRAHHVGVQKVMEVCHRGVQGAISSTRDRALHTILGDLHGRSMGLCSSQCEISIQWGGSHTLHTDLTHTQYEDQITAPYPRLIERGTQYMEYKRSMKDRGVQHIAPKGYYFSTATQILPISSANYALQVSPSDIQSTLHVEEASLHLHHFSTHIARNSPPYTPIPTNSSRIDCGVGPGVTYITDCGVDAPPPKKTVDYAIQEAPHLLHESVGGWIRTPTSTQGVQTCIGYPEVCSRGMQVSPKRGVPMGTQESMLKDTRDLGVQHTVSFLHIGIQENNIFNMRDVGVQETKEIVDMASQGIIIEGMDASTQGRIEGVDMGTQGLIIGKTETGTQGIIIHKMNAATQIIIEGMDASTQGRIEGVDMGTQGLIIGKTETGTQGIIIHKMNAATQIIIEGMDASTQGRIEGVDMGTQGLIIGKTETGTQGIIIHKMNAATQIIIEGMDASTQGRIEGVDMGTQGLIIGKTETGTQGIIIHKMNAATQIIIEGMDASTQGRIEGVDMGTQGLIIGKTETGTQGIIIHKMNAATQIIIEGMDASTQGRIEGVDMGTQGLIIGKTETGTQGIIIHKMNAATQIIIEGMDASTQGRIEGVDMGTQGLIIGKTETGTQGIIIHKMNAATQIIIEGMDASTQGRIEGVDMGTQGLIIGKTETGTQGIIIHKMNAATQIIIEGMDASTQGRIEGVDMGTQGLIIGKTETGTQGIIIHKMNAATQIIIEGMDASTQGRIEGVDMGTQGLIIGKTETGTQGIIIHKMNAATQIIIEGIEIGTQQSPQMVECGAQGEIGEVSNCGSQAITSMANKYTDTEFTHIYREIGINIKPECREMGSQESLTTKRDESTEERISKGEYKAEYEVMNECMQNIDIQNTCTQNMQSVQMDSACDLALHENENKCKGTRRGRLTPNKRDSYTQSDSLNPLISHSPTDICKLGELDRERDIKYEEMGVGTNRILFMDIGVQVTKLEGVEYSAQTDPIPHTTIFDSLTTDNILEPQISQIPLTHNKTFISTGIQYISPLMHQHTAVNGGEIYHKIRNMSKYQVTLFLSELSQTQIIDLANLLIAEIADLKIRIIQKTMLSAYFHKKVLGMRVAVNKVWTLLITLSTVSFFNIYILT